MNRKAISFDMLQWMLRIIFLVVVIFAIVLLLNAYSKKQLNVDDLRAEILVNKLVLTPGALSRYDYVSGRSIPLIIDEVDQDQLKAIMDYNKDNLIAARIDVYEQPGQSYTNLFYYDKNSYENLAPRRFAIGSGAVEQYKRTLPVIYKNKPAHIEITIVMEKS